VISPPKIFVLLPVRPITSPLGDLADNLDWNFISGLVAAAANPF
jgi:hypothetical protein